MTIFFTADTHFGDSGIMETCKRPFKSVDEMDLTLIKNWNSVVKKDDIVYHLGDFGYMRFSTLNGNVIYIKGNHDEYEDEINFINLKIKGYAFDLMHDPVLSIIGFSHITLHGHVHTMWKYLHAMNDKLLINVGVDMWNFTPVNVDEIIKIYRAVRGRIG